MLFPFTPGLCWEWENLGQSPGGPQGQLLLSAVWQTVLQASRVWQPHQLLWPRSQAGNGPVVCPLRLPLMQCIAIIECFRRWRQMDCVAHVYITRQMASASTQIQWSGGGLMKFNLEGHRSKAGRTIGRLIVLCCCLFLLFIPFSQDNVKSISPAACCINKLEC